jgi:hypothetical protein
MRKPWDAAIGRNSWRGSMKILGRVLFYAPCSLWDDIRLSLILLLLSMVLIPVPIVMWLIITLSQILAGLTGHLCESNFRPKH